MTESKSTDLYRDTVFLPSTSFPMRGGLPKKEPEILTRWKNIGLDEAIQQKSNDRLAAGHKVFTLHDGPPYANGHLHIGHALNKIIKDVINRAHRMNGEVVRYIPGWDCHGLPIEWRIEEEYRKAGKNKDDVPVLQFRAECRNYAKNWLSTQSAEFQRLGVQAEWDNRYATMDFSSEATIVEEIGRFLLNGSLYRGLRPVMWSPVEKTALAEAEIEYHDHTSVTIFVAFPIVNDPTTDKRLEGTSAVIWTTTPWTIPANRAIAYNTEITYQVIVADTVQEDSFVNIGAKFLVAQDLAEAFCSQVGIASHSVVHSLPGKALAGAVAAHPLRGKGFDYDVPLLAGDFVTTEAGTGLVHCAPAHGEDDFYLCRDHQIGVDELVEDDGRYVSTLPLFAGIHVFKASDPVCEQLTLVREESKQTHKAFAGLVSRSSIVHSYPHSWRSRAPVIYRATPQWFIAMDDDREIRKNALSVLEGVTFVPAQIRNRLTSMVASRPDWCISRQRAWGVPIAVFVNKETREVLRDETVMKRIVDAFKVEGADAWYTSPASRFLGEKYNADDFEQVFDIVDVWFESGSTHAFVLGKDKLNFPADLYLEGSDQHRGWFQSSLLECVGTRGVAPYKAIVTNGFVMDEQGRKMSKSLGNVVAPQDVNDSMGADILRLWVMNSDTNDDLRIGKEILKQQGDLYRRLRNTLRWLLGGLDGFSDAEKVSYDDLPELEKWVLHRLTELHQVIQQAVQSHEWVGVYPTLHHFCTTDLSAFYFDIRKDALYCDDKSSLRRRAVRTVLDILHRCLCTWLAPVLCFTAEEAWMARFGEGKSVHLEDFSTMPSEWSNDALAERWVQLRAVRRIITTEIENARREGVIKSSLQAAVDLSFSEQEAEIFGQYDWAELVIVSQVDVNIIPGAASLYTTRQNQAGEGHDIPRVRVASGHKCARCWKVLDEVGQNADHPELCLRCVDVVSQ
ncbi:isoleucine--tRNA ligase [Commensalibacter oyaizuii]|uniref:Isoleucine--tRNA ligase n=1 Tax=Commensalibacter oyaizuii TaxID=3043873 RepID=A0ABT6Q0A2_9PROT|nr:isoleucine--tRNA ligase [Commensalibacter sp. TBRC 16381]MDI2090537.1 isoleucine--tRNA ligase [Commensalibacter sp. TBRC 16381]